MITTAKLLSVSRLRYFLYHKCQKSYWTGCKFKVNHWVFLHLLSHEKIYSSHCDLFRKTFADPTELKYSTEFFFFKNNRSPTGPAARVGKWTRPHSPHSHSSCLKGLGITIFRKIWPQEIFWVLHTLKDCSMSHFTLTDNTMLFLLSWASHA